MCVCDVYTYLCMCVCVYTHARDIDVNSAGKCSVPAFGESGSR